MSYILDALKRSEAERGQNSGSFVQNLLVVPQSGCTRRVKHPRYRSVIATVLLAAAACLIWQRQTRIPASEPTTPNIKPEQAFHPSDETSPAAEHDFGVASWPQPQQTTLPPPTTLASSQAEQLTPFQGATIYEPLPITPEGARIPLRRFVPPAPDGTIGNFEDLPGPVKSTLPDLSFAGHTWARDPRQRLIMVNNRVAREGEYLEGNLILREITWHGVILETAGITFQMRAR